MAFSFRRSAIAACVAAIALAAPVRAQIGTGRIDVTIEGPSGAPLPGATVHVSGADEQTQNAGLDGRAHFVNLPVGLYTVKVTLTGFAAHTNRSVEVMSSATTALAIQLAAGGTSETIEAAAVTPAVDMRRDTTTTNVSVVELQEVPYARDPWAVLPSIPTVFVDRLNVGGADSGRQARFNAKGAQSTDNIWTLDGVPVTDMGDNVERPQQAWGASPFYYDFDSLQELAVTTGGADALNAAGGAQVNIVLRKGANLPHGSTRYYYENQHLQSVNIAPDLAAALGDTTGTGARVDANKDYGFDLGGPLLKDSVWVWGAMAWTRLNLLTINGLADDIALDHVAFKAEGLLNDSVRGNFAYYSDEKTEDGRDAGPLRPIETTWNQSGPTRFFKGEGNLIARKQLFVSVKGAYVDSGFELIPAGGLTKDYYIDASGVAHNTYYQYQTTRPQHYYGADASLFYGVNEVKFGGSWRHTAADTQQTWPASHFVATWDSYPNMLVQISRDYHSVTSANYASAYLSDTLAFDRATVTGGVRFDRQTSSLGAASVPAVVGFENVLPAVSSTPASDVFRWTTVVPRVAGSVAVDRARKTVVRGSYAMFASQLPGSIAAFVSPIQYAYAYYNAVDRNGDGIAQLNEIQVSQGLQGFTGFDPRNPARTTPLNAVSSSLTAPMTHEIAVGAETEFAGDFSVTGTFTYRRMVDLLWTPLAGVTRANYTQTSTLTGNAPEVGAYSVPVYALNASALPPGGGVVSANRAGYHQRYMGFELNAVKRLSNRWMARAGFSTNSWREFFDDPSVSILDPTRAPGPSASIPFAGPQGSGGTVLQESAGTGASTIYMTAPSFQFFANGAYDAFWGVMLGANLVSRQGYAEPFFYSAVASGDPLGRKNVLIVQNVDDFRLPNVTTFDVRAEKKFTFGPAKVALDFDVFNLFNAGTVLGRQYDARLTGATGFGQVLEIMNPRIARLAIRFTF